MMVALVGVACLASPAAAYRVCYWTNSSHTPAAVHVGDTKLDLANLQCVDGISATGPVRVDISYFIDCQATIPVGYAKAIQVSLERVNPGIGGIQPYLRCGVAFLG
ncbi:MAG: hypothetical protein AB7P02_03810 [Alphaproteobacteria bacterium]